MAPEPSEEQVAAWLQSRAFLLSLPSPLERRLRAAALRIEREDRRDNVTEEDRIDAVRDFEHIVVGMIERGVEASEDEAGLRPDPWTGRLQRDAVVPLGYVHERRDVRGGPRAVRRVGDVRNVLR